MADSRDLPPPPALAELNERTPVALFLDFDGTLVSIAETPDGIDVGAGLGGKLEALSKVLSHRLAIVSGRSPENLSDHLGTIAVAVAGSHGAARLKRDGSSLGNAARTLADAAVADIGAAAKREGALLERKSHGMALHYRTVPDRADAILASAEDLAGRHDLALKHGKCVVELVLPGADKGKAVEAFMAEPGFAGSTPIFIGDDVTDEDGFRAAAALGGFGIAVGERPSDSARYHLSQVTDVHAWLNL